MAGNNDWFYPDVEWAKLQADIFTQTAQKKIDELGNTINQGLESVGLDRPFREGPKVKVDFSSPESLVRSGLESTIPGGNVSSELVTELMKRPQQATFGAIDAFQKGNDSAIGSQAIQGLLGKRELSYRDLRNNVGFTTGSQLGDSVLDLVGDAAVDPLNLPLGGAGKLGQRVGRSFLDTAKHAAQDVRLERKYGNFLHEGIRGAQDIKDTSNIFNDVSKSMKDAGVGEDSPQFFAEYVRRLREATGAMPEHNPITEPNLLVDTFTEAGKVPFNTFQQFDSRVKQIQRGVEQSSKEFNWDYLGAPQGKAFEAFRNRANPFVNSVPEYKTDGAKAFTSSYDDFVKNNGFPKNEGDWLTIENQARDDLQKVITEKQAKAAGGSGGKADGPPPIDSPGDELGGKMPRSTVADNYFAISPQADQLAKVIELKRNAGIAGNRVVGPMVRKIDPRIVYADEGEKLGIMHDTYSSMEDMNVRRAMAELAEGEKTLVKVTPDAQFDPTVVKPRDGVTVVKGSYVNDVVELPELYDMPDTLRQTISNYLNLGMQYSAMAKRAGAEIPKRRVSDELLNQINEVRVQQGLDTLTKDDVRQRWLGRLVAEVNDFLVKRESNPALHRSFEFMHESVPLSEGGFRYDGDFMKLAELSFRALSRKIVSARMKDAVGIYPSFMEAAGIDKKVMVDSLQGDWNSINELIKALQEVRRGGSIYNVRAATSTKLNADPIRPYYKKVVDRKTGNIRTVGQKELLDASQTDRGALEEGFQRLLDENPDAADEIGKPAKDIVAGIPDTATELRTGRIVGPPEMREIFKKFPQFEAELRDIQAQRVNALRTANKSALDVAKVSGADTVEQIKGVQKAQYTTIVDTLKEATQVDHGWYKAFDKLHSYLDRALDKNMKSIYGDWLEQRKVALDALKLQYQTDSQMLTAMRQAGMKGTGAKEVRADFNELHKDLLQGYKEIQQQIKQVSHMASADDVRQFQNKLELLTDKYKQFTEDMRQQVVDALPGIQDTLKTASKDQLDLISRYQQNVESGIKAARNPDYRATVEAVDTLIERARLLRGELGTQLRNSRRELKDAASQVRDSELGYRHYFEKGFTGEDYRVPVGKVQAPWARDRVFPRDVAESLQKHLEAESNDTAAFFHKVFDTGRGLVAGFDAGTIFIQNLPLLARNPVGWGKTVKAFFDALVDPVNAQKILSDPENIALWRKYIPHGLTIDGMDWSKTGFLPRAIADRTEAIFMGPINVAKLEWLKALDKYAVDEASTRKIATFVNHATGTISTRQLGIGATQSSIESAFLFFSPRYTRASLALIGDAMQGGITGAEARKALVSLMVGATLIPVALRAALGQEITENNFIPGKPGFGEVDVFGQRVSLGGFHLGFLRMIGQAVDTLYRHPENMKSLERQDNPLLRWWSGRTTPAVNLIWDMIPALAGETPRDAVGNPIEGVGGTASRLSQLVVPFTAQALYTDALNPPELPTNLEEAGNALLTGVTKVGTNITGMRVLERTPAMQRAELRDKLAQEEFQTTWDKTSTAQKQTLRERYPSLGVAEAKANKASLMRGDPEAVFWDQVNTQRKGVQAKVDQLNELVRSGKIQGKQYRDNLAKYEQQMALIPFTLKQMPEFRSVPLTDEERQQAYGEREVTHPVDLYLQDYYSLADSFTDPQTGLLDVRGLMRARDQLRSDTPTDVLAEAESVIHKNRNPEYDQAVREFAEYQALVPKLTGLPPETVDQANEFSRRLRDTKRALGNLPKSYALAMVSKQDQDGYLAYLRLEQMKKTALGRYIDRYRQQYWSKHPMLQKYFSDSILDEVGNAE